MLNPFLFHIFGGNAAAATNRTAQHRTAPIVLGGLDPLVVFAAAVPLPRRPPPLPQLLGGLPLGRHGPSLAPSLVVKRFLEVDLCVPEDIVLRSAE